MMIWNGFIRLFSEEYIAISLAFIIKTQAPDLSNYYETFLTVLSLAGLVLVVSFPLLATKFLWQIQRTDPSILKSKEFK